MKRSLSVVVTAGLTLACGGLGAPDPTPVPVPVAAPAEPEGGDLGLYGYAPGPSGSPARFTAFDPGDELFLVGPADLRAAPGGAVTGRLEHGTPLVVVEAVGDPVVEDGLRNRWIRVRNSDGVDGVVFGGLLTPIGGSTQFSMDGDERAWTVSFAADFSPVVRIGGGAEPLQLALKPSERFVGGSLTAEVVSWGDFESRVQVSLCRADGGEEPACSSATARLTDGGLVQTSPPDPWRYLPASEEVSCGLAGELTFELAASGERLFTVQTPSYMRGSDGEVTCFAVGKVSGETHRGRTVVSCVDKGPGKTGPDMANAAIYLQDGDTWIHVPCGSSQGVASELNSALAERKLTVTIATELELPAGLFGPDQLPVPRGTSERAWMTSAMPDAERQPLFDAPGLGPVYVARDPTSGTLGKGALMLGRPDGTAVYYGWSPGEITWPEGAPTEHGYTEQTVGCDGSPEWLVNVEPELGASDLTQIASLADGSPVSVLTDADHFVNNRLFELYGRLSSAEGAARPAELPVGFDRTALLATRPWLFVSDPWGRVVRLMREDFEVPPLCEPIVYLYADPPVEFRLAPVAPLEFFRTLPVGPNGWAGTAWPDGSVTVDGRRWSELFWEGRSLQLRPPEQAVVVRGSEVEPVLREAAEARGLIGHELDAFLEAWVPRLERHPWVRVGFHEPEVIEQIAPLDLDPEPESSIRVLLDASVVDGPSPGELPAAGPVPRRASWTLVEWGGILRDAPTAGARR